VLVGVVVGTGAADYVRVGPGVVVVDVCVLGWRLGYCSWCRAGEKVNGF